MKNKSVSSLMGITTATLIGFAVTSIAIVVVAFILTDKTSISAYYWQRIAWMELFAVLIWAYLGGFFSLVIPKNRSIRGLGAILPALGIVIVFYSISSFILMVLAAYFPQYHYLNMVSQVFNVAGLVIIIVFLFFSWVSGIVDAGSIPEGVISPKDLIIALQSQENALFSQYNYPLPLDQKDKVNILRNSLKNLREKIQYSIPHAGKIGSDSAYITFSHEVIQLCEGCSKLNVQTADVESLQSVIQNVSDLNGRIQSIAQNLFRC
jgi:hypothetical protein